MNRQENDIMANKASKGGGVLPLLAIAGSALSIASPYIEKIIEEYKKRAEERKDWVTLPDLCSKSHPLKLDAAVELFKNNNLKMVSTAVDFKKADARYKDCSDLQVVWSNSKHGQPLPPGWTVHLEYVTSEVIEESQRLFEESEKCKAELKSIKISQRIEQKQKAEKLLNNATKMIKKKKIDPIIMMDKNLNDSEKETACEVENIINLEATT